MECQQVELIYKSRVTFKVFLTKYEFTRASNGNNLECAVKKCKTIASAWYFTLLLCILDLSFISIYNKAFFF